MACSFCTKSSSSVELIDLFNLPPLLDARRQTVTSSKIPNIFFLPDGKNSRLSQVVKTWTFDRLTPNGNEGKLPGMHLWTKYYVVDKVNGQRNAIHDDGLELTEFIGRFSPFNLNELEMKVCRLVDQNDNVDDIPEPQQPPQTQDSDSNSGLHSIEENTGMGYESPNYSPIPPIGDEALQQPGVPRLTSTPITNEGLGLNMTDTTHNRGKAKIIDALQEPVILHKKLSKGGKVKSS